MTLVDDMSWVACGAATARVAPLMRAAALCLRNSQLRLALQLLLAASCSSFHLRVCGGRPRVPRAASLIYILQCVCVCAVSLTLESSSRVECWQTGVQGIKRRCYTRYDACGATTVPR